MRFPLLLVTKGCTGTAAGEGAACPPVLSPCTHVQRPMAGNFVDAGHGPPCLSAFCCWRPAENSETQLGKDVKYKLLVRALKIGSEEEVGQIVSPAFTVCQKPAACLCLCCMLHSWSRRRWQLCT